jgi:hypothetical protein
MTIEIGFTDELCNTQYAPLALLMAHYQQNQVLQPLAGVQVAMKSRDFSAQQKRQQVLVSILSGCETFLAVNSRLKHELALAQACGWSRFADQSNLSRRMDGLTQMNLDQLRTAIKAIWYPTSQLRQHDWRGFVWFDFDLSGLTCGKRAQQGTKGFFSGKKTRPVANWPALRSSTTAKPSGQACIQATV